MLIDVGQVSKVLLLQVTLYSYILCSLLDECWFLWVSRPKRLAKMLESHLEQTALPHTAAQ